MIPTEYRPLVEALSKKTKENRLKWEPTSRDSQFQTIIGHNYIVIYSFDNYEEGCLNIRVDILDSFGDKIDQFTSDENDFSDYMLLENLYSSARRNALRIDETINDLMQNLDNL